MAARKKSTHVRKTHIDSALKLYAENRVGTATECPIALALLAKEKTQWCVSALSDCFPLDDPKDVWHLDPEGIAFMDLFDSVCDGELEPEVLKATTVVMFKEVGKKKNAK